MRALSLSARPRPQEPSRGCCGVPLVCLCGCCRARPPRLDRRNPALDWIFLFLCARTAGAFSRGCLAFFFLSPGDIRLPNVLLFAIVPAIFFRTALLRGQRRTAGALSCRAISALLIFDYVIFFFFYGPPSFFYAFVRDDASGRPGADPAMVVLAGRAHHAKRQFFPERKI